MKKYFRSLVGVIAVALSILFVFTPAQGGPSGSWTYFDSPVYRFYYHPGDTDSMIVAWIMAYTPYYQYYWLPYLRAYEVLGQTGLDAAFWISYDLHIPVYLVADNSGSGGYNYSGSTSGFVDQWIELHGDVANASNWSSVFGDWGHLLAHETSHLFYNNYTKLYENSWFWDNTTPGYYRLRFTTEAIAYYTGSCYYDFGPRYDWSTIRSHIAGYNSSWYSTEYRYKNGTWTSSDWWQFVAAGYFLTHTSMGFWGTRALVAWIEYYSPSGDVMNPSFQAVWGLPAGFESTSTTDPQYMYYWYYHYWNG